MTSPALRAGFYPTMQPRGPWQVDPDFRPERLGDEARDLLDLIKAIVPHADPKHRETGLMGNSFSRGLSNLVEAYDFFLHESGDPWFLEGMAVLLEPYYHYFRGDGRTPEGERLDPTKNREMSYDVVLKKNSAGEMVFAGITTPGETAPAIYLSDQGKAWFAQDQGLEPIPGRDRLGFRAPVYWRPDTFDMSDLSAVGTKLGHRLDYGQWLSMLAVAVHRFAHNQDVPRLDPKGVSIRELYRELWEVLQEQWEMIAFRGTTFYETHGIYKLASTIVHSFLPVGNAHAYTNAVYRLETGEDHPLHARAATTHYDWFLAEVYRVRAPNGYDVAQWPHQVMQALRVFSNRTDPQGPHLSRYNVEFVPELLKAFYLEARGFDEDLLGAAANLASQVVYRPLERRGDKTVGKMAFQIDGAGTFTDGSPLKTQLRQSRTIIDSETSPVKDRTLFRRNFGGLLMAFDPTPDGQNQRVYEQYADAFVVKKADLKTSGHQDKELYLSTYLYTALRAEGKR